MFRPNNLFHLSNWQFKDIFDKVNFVWETLPTIHTYVADLINSVGIRKPDLPGIYYQGDLIHIEEGVVLEPPLLIKAPTFIQSGAEIRSGAYIRGDTLISSAAIVGHATEVKNSIFMENAHAPHFNYVGDSILGNNTNLGAGTKLSNYKIAANKTIHITADGRTLDTGLIKFGAILGDDSEMGCNSIANPGTIIGMGSLIYACAAVRGYIPPNHIVKLLQHFESIPKQ